MHAVLFGLEVFTLWFAFACLDWLILILLFCGCELWLFRRCFDYLVFVDGCFGVEI